MRKAEWSENQGASLLETCGSDVSHKVQLVEVEQEFLLDTGVTELPLQNCLDHPDDHHCKTNGKITNRSSSKYSVDKTFS